MMQQESVATIQNDLNRQWLCHVAGSRSDSGIQDHPWDSRLYVPEMVFFALFGQQPGKEYEIEASFASEAGTGRH